MQAANTQDLIQVSIERTQRTIYIVSALNIIICLSCSAYGCLFRHFCHTTEDINVPPYASHGFLPILLVIIILTGFCYHAAKFIHLNYLGPLRFILLTFLILILAYTISEFIAGLSLAYTDRDSVWEKLPPLAKDYYDDDKDNMNKEYTENIIFIFVVQIVAAVLMLLTMAFVWKLFSVTPQGYLPRPQGNKGEDFYHWDGRRQNRMVASDNNPLAPRNGVEDRQTYLRDYDRSMNQSQMALRKSDENFGQEIKEDDDDHPLAPRNPFLRK